MLEFSLKLFLLSIIFSCLWTAGASQKLNKVVVSPDELNQAGYWLKVPHDECNAQLYKAIGSNARLSYTFVGSGLTLRCLHCLECAKIQVTIDEEKPVTIDLSESPSGDQINSAGCPQDIPTLVMTDLEHGRHTVKISRLNPELGLTWKVLGLEYLTCERPSPTTPWSWLGGLPETHVFWKSIAHEVSLYTGFVLLGYVGTIIFIRLSA
ncbi:hypothetical protein FRC03_001937 [Tulasnella sp. 419]|nr:hypothetical protein FRC03_001937 [Tulasnella sp. 419]